MKHDHVAAAIRELRLALGHLEAAEQALAASSLPALAAPVRGIAAYVADRILLPLRIVAVARGQASTGTSDAPTDSVLAERLAAVAARSEGPVELLETARRLAWEIDRGADP
jgi:hypothetical protein